MGFIKEFLKKLLPAALIAIITAWLSCETQNQYKYYMQTDAYAKRTRNWLARNEERKKRRQEEEQEEIDFRTWKEYQKEKKGY